MKRRKSFFLTLLHEIGHFKIPESKVSNDFIKAKNKLEEDFPDDKITQYESVDFYLKRRNNESIESYWGWRLRNFRFWVLNGHTLEEHAQVDNWALKEFRHQRKSIRSALKNC